MTTFYSHYGVPDIPPPNAINRVRDTQSLGEFETWITSSPDSTGASFAGPGTWDVHTSDYCVCHIAYHIKQYINRCVDRTSGDFVFWITTDPDPDGGSYPGPGGPNDMQDYCVQKIVYHNTSW